MKRILFLFTLSCTGLSACMEKGPIIDFGTGVKSTDTTYVSAAESPQPRNILIEEFTGVSCPPCPQGHSALKNIIAKYPDRIVVIGNHIFGFAQAKPISGLSKQDFRTQDATDISTLMGSVSYMPAAVIDRISDGSGYIQPRANWVSAVDTRINQVAPVNISITKTWNDQQRTVQARIKLAYTQAVSKKHNMTIAVIENEIVDAQETSTGIDSFYTHNEVLRDIVTLPTGVSVLDSIATKQPGRVFERSISINLDAKWNADKCRIVVFVHNNDGADKTVLQAAEVAVK